MKGYYRKQRRYHGGLPRKGCGAPPVVEKKPPILLIPKQEAEDETKEG